MLQVSKKVSLNDGGGGGVGVAGEFDQEKFLVCNLVMKWQILHAKLRFS